MLYVSKSGRFPVITLAPPLIIMRLGLLLEQVYETGQISVRAQFRKSGDGRGNYACDLITMRTLKNTDHLHNDQRNLLIALNSVVVKTIQSGDSIAEEMPYY